MVVQQPRRFPRRLMAVGNWKMHKAVAEAVADAQELSKQVHNFEHVEVVIAPSFTALRSVSEVLRETSVGLAAQDLHWEKQGAYTGEVAPFQLLDAGCTAVLIGHSERRQYFHETHETVCRKTRAAIDEGLIPIVCVGETLKQRQTGRTASVLELQIQKGLVEVDRKEAASVVIAYEPVWAIGTGQVARPEEVAEAHRLIRKKLSVIFDREAWAIRILYGGSVTPENIEELVDVDELDGVLVGGASLHVDQFVTIIRALDQRGSIKTGPDRS
jgi:triosephosphate isomerase (TIM)